MKQAMLIQLQSEMGLLKARIDRLQEEVNNEQGLAVVEEPKDVWQKKYGTPLTFQGVSDLFQGASLARCEEAAKQLYAFASPAEYIYAVWALRWWVCFSPDERRKLVCHIVMSTDSLARLYAGKLLLFDYLWERTTHHFRPAPERVWLARFIADDAETVEWISRMEPWSKTPLSNAERTALLSKSNAPSRP